MNVQGKNVVIYGGGISGLSAYQLVKEKGVDLLDVNVGLPEIDEVKMLTRSVCELQAMMTTTALIQRHRQGYLLVPI